MGTLELGAAVIRGVWGGRGIVQITKWVRSALLLGGLTVGAWGYGGGANAVAAGLSKISAQTQSCKGLQVELLSLSKTGRGDVTADFLMRNTNNDDMAMFVYYGGANGKNTFLIDDAGAEWPKKRIDGNGNHRQALMSGVKTKYSLVFHIASGGDDARVFQLIEWVQLLPLTGMGEFGWCKFQYTDVPLSQASQ